MFLLSTLPGGVPGGAAVKEDVQNRLEETFVTKRKNAVYGRLLCGLLAVLMALMLFPAGTVKADDEVAQITKGGVTTPYATLDDAIAAAEDGDTIVLLDNATVSTTLDKSITIDGQNQYSVTSTNVRYGFSTGTDLTFRNVTLNFN